MLYSKTFLYSQGFLQKLVQIVRIVKGEPCVIQAKNSQVKLHVPKGVHGTVLGKIHTNHTKFLHLIPDSECVVGPMCEYSIHPFINGSQIHSTEQFLLQIPHVIQNLTEVGYQLKVQCVNLNAGVTKLVKTQFEMELESEDSCYYADDKYINILTRHFSTFLVTAENIKCCAGSANIVLYGSLKNFPDSKPTTTVKVYFSSVHSNIKDYEDVSISFFTNIVKTVENKKYCKFIEETFQRQ